MQKTVANWRGLMSGSVADGRQLLREVLAAPLRFTPDGKTYRFTAPVATDELIAGAVLPTKGTSPTGTYRQESGPALEGIMRRRDAVAVLEESATRVAPGVNAPTPECGGRMGDPTRSSARSACISEWVTAHVARHNRQAKRVLGEG